MGEPVELRGYADDFEGPVTAVRLSLDEGAHWTVFPMEGVTLPRGVSWTFTYVPKQAGLYLLRAQAMSGDVISNLLTTFAFEVLE